MATGWSTQAEQINVLQGICWIFAIVIIFLSVCLWRTDHKLMVVIENVQDKLDSQDRQFEAVDRKFQNYVTDEKFDDLFERHESLSDWVDDIRWSQLRFQEKAEARLPVLRRL